MTYIVLDMEWNQPQIHREPHKVPFPLVGEIVEIGAVKLDGRFCECDRFKRYIKPVFYKKIQPYVKKITGISENTLSCAQPFEQVLQDFFEWCADDFAFITWALTICPCYATICWPIIWIPPSFRGPTICS